MRNLNIPVGEISWEASFDLPLSHEAKRLNKRWRCGAWRGDVLVAGSKSFTNAYDPRSALLE